MTRRATQGERFDRNRDLRKHDASPAAATCDIDDYEQEVAEAITMLGGPEDVTTEQFNLILRGYRSGRPAADVALQIAIEEARGGV